MQQGGVLKWKYLYALMEKRPVRDASPVNWMDGWIPSNKQNTALTSFNKWWETKKDILDKSRIGTVRIAQFRSIAEESWNAAQENSNVRGQDVRWR